MYTWVLAELSKRSYKCKASLEKWTRCISNYFLIFSEVDDIAIIERHPFLNKPFQKVIQEYMCEWITAQQRSNERIVQRGSHYAFCFLASPTTEQRYYPVKTFQYWTIITNWAILSTSSETSVANGSLVAPGMRPQCNAGVVLPPPRTTDWIWILIFKKELFNWRYFAERCGCMCVIRAAPSEQRMKKRKTGNILITFLS